MKFTVLILVSHRVKEPITGNVFIKPKGTLKKKKKSKVHHINHRYCSSLNYIISALSLRMFSCVHTVMVTVEEKVSFY